MPSPPLPASMEEASLVYPYAMRLGITQKKGEQTWRTLNLENEYLFCRILPDLGGHLYSCRDKVSGEEMFYANSAIRKSWIAHRGAWVSLGIELSFPIAHSSVGISPVPFATASNADGSGTVWVGTVDRVTGMEWQTAFTLHPGKAFLEQSVWLHNRTSTRHGYVWWANAAVKLQDEVLQFIYPTHLTASHGGGKLDTWPVNTAGTDLSLSSHYNDLTGLFAYGSHEPFFGVYRTKTHTGLIHVADPSAVAGKKLWIWGRKGDESVRTSLSDDGSSYVELQAGALELQEEAQFLEPGEEKRFTEFWLPVHDMRGVTRASEAGILYVSRERVSDASAKLAIDLLAVSPQSQATIRVLDPQGKTVFQQSADANPRVTIHMTTGELPANVKYRVEWKDVGGNTLLSHLEDDYNAVKPNEVALGTLPSGYPEKRQTEKELLEAGKYDELRFLLDKAREEYALGLKQHPDSIALRKAQGRMLALLGQFEAAAASLNMVRQQAPNDLEAALYLGYTKHWSGDETGAREQFQAALSDPVYGARARLELAAALARSGDRSGALQALNSPQVGPSALRAALLRKQGQGDQAAAELKAVLQKTPLDNFARVEAASAAHQPNEEIWHLLAADPEWVLDVADQYFELGFFDDALALLSREYPAVPALQREPGSVLPQAYPLIAYYRGYARQQLGQSGASDWAEASRQSVKFVFPSRPSSVAVLQAAVKANPKDATAHYLLGMLFKYQRMNDAGAAEWKLARSLKFSFPFEDKGGSAPPSAPQPAPQPANYATPEQAANAALTLIASGSVEQAAGIFQARNFSQEKQSVEFRQAYIEAQVQLILAKARHSKPEDVSAMIDRIDGVNDALPFTLAGFGALLKRPRLQFYLGVAEALSGDAKAARKRWAKVAKLTAEENTPDYPFPALASMLADSAKSPAKLEVALERVQGETPAEGWRFYAQGMLLAAKGQGEFAKQRFERGAEVSSGFMKYVNQTALRDPKLPD